MTGFTRQEWHHETGSYCWEVRSVNHRFLELGFRLPEPLRDLEAELREIARAKLARGKVECTLYFHPSETVRPQVKLNHSLLKELIAAQVEITALMPQVAAADALNLMRWPGVLMIEDINLDQVKPFIAQAFEQTLQSLLHERLREGKALHDSLDARLNSMDTLVARLQQIMPQLMEQQRVKLLNKIQQLNQELDSNRVAQEVAILAQRADVAEEIERLMAHITETRNVLQAEGGVGRRLDFLLQEMHREANTLGSKSTDMELTQLSVDLKVLIEQMREQVQNIE